MVPLGAGLLHALKRSARAAQPPHQGLRHPRQHLPRRECPRLTPPSCGDFFQLPPVSKGGAKARFLFESATWARVVQRSVVLTEVFRQADARFVNLLNEMRRGQLSDANVALLRSHMAACLLADRQRAGAAGSEGGGGGGAGGGGASIADRLKLFPHNQPADAENARRLAQLGGTARMSTGGHVALPAGCHTSPPRPAQREHHRPRVALHAPRAPQSG